MNRPSPSRLVLVGILVAGVGLDIGAPSTLAAAPSHKTFQAGVSSDGVNFVTSLPISAGAVTLYFNVANTSTGSSAVPYGSFQLPVPTGISVTSASILAKPTNFNDPTVNSSTTPATITITSNGPTGTGIAPGKSLTVKVIGTASSGVCPGTWAIRVKQSNDFSGTGNDFAGNSVDTPVAGGTKLVWTVQPPLATEYDLDMAPAPQATLEDGCGNTLTNFTGTATLTDAPVGGGAGVLTPQPFTASVTNADAVFTFPGVRFTDYGLTDTLVATVGSVSATSNAFDIFQLVKPCDAGKSCTSGTLTGKNGTTLANITADIGDSSDVLTVNIKGTASGDCAGSTTEPPLGENVTLNVADRTKSVTVTLPKTYVNQIPNNGTPFMDICLDVTPNGTPFFDKRHYVDPITFATPVSIGLLPDCTVAANVRPCIASRKKNQANEIIQVNLPAGDPQLHWM